MKKPILLINCCLMLALTSTSLQAQSDNCYQETRQQGIDSYHTRQYQRAVNEFFVAYRCLDRPETHDLEDWIKRAQQAQVDQLESQNRKNTAAIERVNELALQVKEAKIEILEARMAGAAAELRLAELNGQRIEAMRLGLLADILQTRGNLQDALDLSYLAVRLSDSINQRTALEKFYRIAQDSFEREITSQSPTQSVVPQAGYLVIEDGESVHIYNESDWTQHQLFEDFDKCWSIGPDHLLLEKKEAPQLALYAPFSLQNRSSEAIIMKGHTEAITFVAISSNYYLSCSRDDTAILWSKTGKALATLSGHSGNVYQALILESVEKIVTRSSDGTAIIWNLEGELLQRLDIVQPYLQFMAVSPNEDRVLMGTAEGEIVVWETNSNRLETLPSDQHPIQWLGFAPNGQMCSMNIKGQANQWTEQGRRQSDFPTLPWIQQLPSTKAWVGMDPKGHLYWLDRLHQGAVLQFGSPTAIVHLDYHPQRKQWLAVSSDGLLKIVDENGYTLMEENFERTSDRISPFFSVEGDYLVLPGSVNGIRVVPTPGSRLEQMELSDQRISMLRTQYGIEFFTIAANE